MKTTKQFMTEKIDPNWAPPPIHLTSDLYNPIPTSGPFTPQPITVNNQGQGTTPPNNGAPPKWAWQGPGLPWWLDPDGDGIPSLPPGLLELWRRTGQLGQWHQRKNGEWYYRDWTKEFQYPDSHPGTWPGWEEYFNPSWWIPELFA